MKYTEKPEIILLSGVDTDLKPFHIKEVKVRMNRGKEFSTDNITSSQMAYDIFKNCMAGAVKSLAESIIVSHNHPSGNLTPVRLTSKQLSEYKVQPECMNYPA